MKFADDRLYSINISIKFSRSDFANCKKNYDKFVSIFKSHFVDWIENVETNEYTKEQIMEGYWFYKDKAANVDRTKLNQLTIGQSIEYEKKWNSYNNECELTGQIENYVIEIDFIDLGVTKLTNQGY